MGELTRTSINYRLLLVPSIGPTTLCEFWPAE